MAWTDPRAKPFRAARDELHALRAQCDATDAEWRRARDPAHRAAVWAVVDARKRAHAPRIKELLTELDALAASRSGQLDDQLFPAHNTSPATAAALDVLGASTLGQVALVPADALHLAMGKSGVLLARAKAEISYALLQFGLRATWARSAQPRAEACV